MNFVEQHKYQENERVIHEYVKQWNPKTIIELGHGSGALTVAMAYAISPDAKIYSYDLISPGLAIERLTSRSLIHLCQFFTGNVFNTFMQNIIEFDVLLIDIDNTWASIYDIVMTPAIYRQIQNGSHVVIEGGADAHPRINKQTLAQFHQTLGRDVFAFKHISGPRTSLSILELL